MPTPAPFVAVAVAVERCVAVTLLAFTHVPVYAFVVVQVPFCAIEFCTAFVALRCVALRICVFTALLLHRFAGRLNHVCCRHVAVASGAFAYVRCALRLPFTVSIFVAAPTLILRLFTLGTFCDFALLFVRWMRCVTFNVAFCAFVYHARDPLRCRCVRSWTLRYRVR